MITSHLRRNLTARRAASATSAGRSATSSTSATTTATLFTSVRHGWGDATPSSSQQQQQKEDEFSFDFGEGESFPPAPEAGTASSSYHMGHPGFGATAKPNTTTETSTTIMPKPIQTSTSSLPSSSASDGENLYANIEPTEKTSKYMETPTAELIQLIRSYLDQNIPTLDEVEASLFTALIARREEFTPDQLLDVVEKKFPPWMNDRGWSDKVKQMIRDRCFREASGLKTLTVARAIVLIGLNGRSRRDVEFFKKLSKILSINVNEIKDPHTLCYVLVALQNSRIKPPETFLALIGRRFPVLNKKNPLHALPAYRALTFFSRSEYPLMNPYRYLADRIMAIIRDNLRAEGKGGDFEGIGKKLDTPALGSSKFVSRDADGEEVDTIEDVSALTDEDLDILKGLQREDREKSGSSDFAANDPSGLGETPATSSWGQAPTSSSSTTTSAWGSATPSATSAWGSPSPTASTATTTTTSTTTTPEEDGGETPSLLSEKDEAENNSIESSLRTASAIPEILKADPNAAATGEEGDEQVDSAENQTEQENKKTSVPEKKRVKFNIDKSSPEYLLHQFVRRTGGLTPQQFIRFLFILGLKKAPRQQYLRPVATDLLVPVIPILSPPSFMRLVVALRMFQSEDKKLIGAVVDRLVREGPSRVCLRNLFELLRLFGNKDTPIEVATPHLVKFFSVCQGAFQDESRLRARDMLAITGELKNIHTKLTANQEDDWLGAVNETVEEGSAEAEKLNASSDKSSQTVQASEQLFSIVERFALRMNNLMSLGVLALTNAETLLEICRTLPNVNESTAAALEELRMSRQRIDDEQGGPDEYADILDIDVREIFFRIQVINNYDTFRNFRPLPATLIQDFKGMLDAMRCDYIVEAVHIYEQAFPGTLAIPVKRVLARHVLEKMHMELRVLHGAPEPKEPEPSKLTASGKIIEIEKARLARETEAAKNRDSDFRAFGAAAAKFHMKIIDDAIAAGVPKKFYQPYDCMNPRYQMMLFNGKKFVKFVNMLANSPLKRVRNSDLTWVYIEKKAQTLNLLTNNAEDEANNQGEEEEEESSQKTPQQIIRNVLKKRKEEIQKMELLRSEMEIRGQDEELKKVKVAEI